MKADARTIVLVEGGEAPPAAFIARQLHLKTYRAPSDLADEGVRALLVLAQNLSRPDSLRQLVKRLLPLAQAAQRGIFIVVVALPGQEAAALGAAKSGTGVLAQWDKKPGVVLSQLTVLSDWEKIAEACARCRCGPSANLSLLVLDSDGDALEEPLDPEVDLLMRRAFHDFSAIRISSENGGKSRASVWKVETEGYGLLTPFIVKCGPAAQIEEQINTYRDVVADRVPFRGCAPLCLDRCVLGTTLQLSVSRFVEHADRLDAVVTQRDVRPVIEAIYDRVLRRWREEPEVKTLSLLPEFLPRPRQTAYEPGLFRTYRRLGRVGFRGPSPKAFFNRLGSIPPDLHAVCRAHDDLNLRNVFVCEGLSDAVLIDFTRAARRPLSHDVARLDVGLAFDDQLQDAQQIPDNVLEDFYSGDLFAVSISHMLEGHSARHRLEAIVTLRTTILREGRAVPLDVRREYSIAVCAGLLYFAKGKGPSAARAYQCAANLLTQVTNPSLW